VALLNAFLAAVFDLLLAPFRQLPPIVGLVVVSLATSIAMLLIFKRTSNQARLAAVKRQIHAALFEIRLFNDDLGAIFRAQAEILRHNLTYLRLSLVPMLWMIVPLVLVIAQLQFHYGYKGLAPGQPILLKAQVRDGVTIVGSDGEVALASTLPAGALAKTGAARDSAPLLEAPPQIEVKTPAVWIPATREVIWRVSPQAAGSYDVQLRVGGGTYSKSIRVSDDVVRRSPVRLEPGFLNQLLYPAEAPLPGDGALTSITVAYPETDIHVLGWDLHWMIVYFALSMIFAFALRKRFNVTL
jgi:uncharacterized membrane protein (DUF106 family)